MTSSAPNLSNESEHNKVSNGPAQPAVDPDFGHNERKFVSVAGFTVGLRKAEIDRIEKKLSSDGWRLESYTEAGFSGSKAVFIRRKDADRDKRKLIMWSLIIGGIVLLFMFSAVNSPIERETKERAMSAVTTELASVKDLLAKGQINEAKEKLSDLKIKGDMLGDSTAVTAISTRLEETQSDEWAGRYLGSLTDQEFKKFVKDGQPILKPGYENWDGNLIIQRAASLREKASSLRKVDISRQKSEAKAQAAADKKAAIAAKEAGVLGPKPVNSEWDASVQEVKQWMRHNAKDPDSLEYIEWSPVLKLDTRNGPFWAVRVKYRARNSFGGMVIENKVALIRHNTVLGFD